MSVGRKFAGSLAWWLSAQLLACGGSVSGRAPGAGGSGTGGSLVSPGGGDDASLPSFGAGGASEGQGDSAGASGGQGGSAGATVTAGQGGLSESGAGGQAGDSGEGGSDACAPDGCLPPHVVAAWATEVDGYGRGPAAIRFSNDRRSLSVTLGEIPSSTTTTLDAATGRALGAPVVEHGLVARDRSGRREIRALDVGRGLFVDGIEITRLADVGRSAWFSADGSAFSAYQCLEGGSSFAVSAYETASGQLMASAQVSLKCPYSDVTMLVDSGRRRTLFAHPETPELYVLDWDAQAIESERYHEEAAVSSREPFNHEGTILNLLLTPDGRSLASIGAADGLVWLDAETLSVRSRIPEVPFFNVYDRCFCQYLSESPLAWSPDGSRWLTAHLGGSIAVRSVQTDGVLSILDPPSAPRSASSRDFGPVVLELSPDGGQVVALYPGLVVSYALDPPATGG